MALYRKTALTEAEQFLPNEGKIPDGVISDGNGDPRKDSRFSWIISTLENNVHYVSDGDWIATGVQGEHWAIKPDVFAASYELAEQPRAAEQGQGGVALIAAERRRQIECEGWTLEHDDIHTGGALAIQAAALAVDGTDASLHHPECDEGERVDPFGLVKKHHGHWKRELVIAGALIAAEIDRQDRQETAKQPAQPPAGDVVERMLDAFSDAGNGSNGNLPTMKERMAAALAVAREGYVSLDVIDDLVCEYGAPEYVRTDDGEAQYWKFSGQELPCADHLGELLIAGIQLRNRLAKPAERTDLERVQEITDTYVSPRIESKRCAEKIVAALRDGRGQK